MKTRRIKYFVQSQVPTIFGKQIFAIGVQLDVTGDTSPMEYIDHIYADVKRQLEANMKKDVPESSIVITCLSILDIYELDQEKEI